MLSAQELPLFPKPLFRKAVEINSIFSIHRLGFCVISIWEMEQALNGIKFITTTQNALEIQSTHRVSAASRLAFTSSKSTFSEVCEVRREVVST